MQLSLKCHPDFRSAAVQRIEVSVAQQADALHLIYRAHGDMSALLLPAMTTPSRTEELWRHTCFEAFIRAGGDAYNEFNFAPSHQWAAYAFDGYRAGMRPLEIAAPTLNVSVSDRTCELSVAIAAAATPARLALTAVIEDRDGAISYWALAHPPERPDFHHAAGFVVELPGAAPQ